MIVLQRSNVPSIKQYTYFNPPYTFTSLNDAKLFTPPDGNALAALFWMGQDISQNTRVFTKLITNATATMGKLI